MKNGGLVFRPPLRIHNPTLPPLNRQGARRLVGYENELQRIASAGDEVPPTSPLTSEAESESPRPLSVSDNGTPTTTGRVRAWAQNREQTAFITQPLGPGKLLGIPGGGKTRCILEKILYHLARKDIPQRNGFMVLTFSRAAHNDFIRKGRELQEGVFTKDNVRTIHNLAGSMVSSASSIETVVYRAGMRCKELSTEELRSYFFLKNCKVIFVDEAQDINESQYKFVQALGQKLDVPVILVGDPNQSIYAFQGGSDRFLREHIGFEAALATNYRASKALVRLADKSRPFKAGPMEASPDAPDGPKPVLFSGSVDGIEADLVERIRVLQRTTGLKSVAVIGPIKLAKPDNNGIVSRLGLQWVAAELRKHRIPIRIWYNEGSRDGDESARDRQKTEKVVESGCVHILTAHGAKGLEFDHTFVVNYHCSLMGTTPKTIEEFQTLRKLVYVALTRARQSMVVYHMEGRRIWPDLNLELQECFELVGKTPRYEPLELKGATKQLEFPWTDLLNDRTTIDEEKLAWLEDLWGIEIRTIDSGEPLADEEGKLLMMDELATLYGMWAEELFAHAYRGQMPPAVQEIEDMVWGCMWISKGLRADVSTMRYIIGASDNDLIPWEAIETHRTTLEGTCPKLVIFLDKWRAANRDTGKFLPYVENNLQWFEPPQLIQMVGGWRAKGSLSSEDIWRMCLFRWQFKYEARWRWDQDYSGLVEALRPYEKRIRQWASELPDGFQFQVGGRLRHLPVSGIADCVHLDRLEIYELKFSAGPINLGHAMQAQGYAEMLFTQQDHRKLAGTCTTVFNLRTGERARIKATTDPQRRYQLYKLLADAVGSPLSDVCWIVDVKEKTVPSSTEATSREKEVEVHMQERTTGLVPVSSVLPWVGRGQQPAIKDQLKRALSTRGEDVTLLASNKATLDWLQSVMSDLSRGGNKVAFDSPDVLPLLLGEEAKDVDIPTEIDAKNRVAIMSGILSRINQDLDEGGGNDIFRTSIE